MTEAQERSSDESRGSSSPRKRARLEEDESGRLAMTGGQAEGVLSGTTLHELPVVPGEVLSGQEMPVTAVSGMAPVPSTNGPTVQELGDATKGSTGSAEEACADELLVKKESMEAPPDAHGLSSAIETGKGVDEEQSSRGDTATAAQEEGDGGHDLELPEQFGVEGAMKESPPAEIPGVADESLGLSSAGAEFLTSTEDRRTASEFTPQVDHSGNPTPASQQSPGPDFNDGEPELDIHDDREREDVEEHGTVTGSPAASSVYAPSASSTPVPSKGKKAKAKATKGKATKGNKVDKLKASAASKKAAKKERSVSESATPAPEPDEFSTPVPEHRDSSPVDTSVYCVCKKPYDEEDEDTVMIGCDRCDNWFHPACVNIAEDQLDMIDLFVCVDCEQRTTDRTIFKVKCRRPECRRSTLSSASKYCSEACGMHHALAKLRAKKLLFDDVYPAIDYAAQPQPVYVTSHEARAVSPPPGSRPDDLAILLGQIALQEEAIAASRRIIEARRDMLQRAIANAEALQPAAVVEIATEVTGKKSKKPKKPSTVDTRACGYDWRLSADDAEILALLESEVKDADTEVCSASRRCDRHQGWQKTLAVELEVELALNSRRSDQLANQTRKIKSGVERKAKAKVISAAFQAARGAPMNVDS